MKLVTLIHSARLQLAILRWSSRLVPAERREDWLAVWNSELWYVWRESLNKGDATAFCMGSFRDALLQRRSEGETRQTAAPIVESPRPPSAYLMVHIESPAQCLTFLSIILGIGVATAFAFPESRKALEPSLFRRQSNLTAVSALSMAEYRRSLPDAGAFYLVQKQSMTDGLGRTIGICLIRSDARLFELLKIPVAYPGPGEFRTRLVLTRPAWRLYFRADSKIVGRMVSLSGQPAVVAAVISEDDWPLPGQVDAFTIEDPETLGVLASDRQGYALTALKTGISATAYGNLNLRPVERILREPVRAFLLLLIYACVLLPLTTTVSLGDYSESRRSLPWISRPRRWIFLGVKVALLLPVIYCTGLLALVYTGSPLGCVFSLAALLGSPLSLRWIIVDQRRRCPVCLCQVGCPASIGQHSQMLLGWCGTELICSRGHGVLHIPEVPSSCFSAQRWLYLDASWHPLFNVTGGTE